MPCALKISEAASLAMHALGYLAKREDGPITSREIANSFQISEAHLAKVLQRLVKVELLRSVRGPRGGFILTRSPESVTLLEVFEAIEGRFEPSQCLLSSAICDGDTCILGKNPGRGQQSASRTAGGNDACRRRGSDQLLPVRGAGLQ